MNRLNVGVFTPALMFSKVAFSLTPQILCQLWTVPVGYLVLSGVSAAVAWGVAKCFRFSKTRRNIAIASATFMNSNTLPIALMQTMTHSLHLKWKEDDTPERMLERAFQYLVLCAILGALLRWSVGISLLDSPVPSAPQDDARPISGMSASTLCSEVNVMSQGSNQSKDGLRNETPQSGAPLKFIPSPSIHLNFPQLAQEPRRTFHQATPTPHPTTAQYTTYDLGPITPSTSHARLLLSDLPTHHAVHNEKNARRARFTHAICGTWDSLHCKTSALKNRFSLPKKYSEPILDLLNAPLISSLLAIIVACITPLQQRLAKVQPLRDFISMAASVAIPLTLVLLGAFFHRPNGDKKHPIDEPKQLPNQLKPSARVVLKDIGLIVLVRQLIVPALLLPILGILCRKVDLVVIKDPIFILSATLIIGAPPAITLAQMTAKAQLDFMDEMISKLLFWSYSVATPVTTVLLVVAATLIFNSIR